jgi:dTDP-4-amino-4,6-dideoxygalactose transaminase
MEPIVLAAHRRGLFVIEDCAEAPGLVLPLAELGDGHDGVG